MYESLVNLRSQNVKTDQLDAKFANAISLLSKRNYASASAVLSLLQKDIEAQRQKTAVSPQTIQNATAVNPPPDSGHRRQQVQSEVGSFVVDVVTADLGSTRVIVDTASDGDCTDNCPVLSLGDYVGRSGAFAGVNGSYFCPGSYPSCAGKANSFDTLLMNKNKTYFNSANNVYSTLPAVIFTGNSGRSRICA